jgi:hypothetical protein
MIHSVPNVIVNAAFLKAMKDEHFKLYNMLDNLHAFWLINDPTIFNPEWFRVLVSEFRDLLELHFELEETYGYVQHRQNHDPDICRESCQLFQQHTVLLDKLNSIARGAAYLSGRRRTKEPYTTLVNRLQEFYREFQRHEQAEIDLSMRAMYAEHKRRKLRLAQAGKLQRQ